MTGEPAAFRIRREIHVEAPPEVVFAFFSDPERFARWFGPGSSIEAREGGRVEVAFPGGAKAVGEVLAVQPPRRIRFTWGYPREDSPVAPGASVVEVRLEAEAGGTRIRLEHTLPSREAADAHEGGWAYHLARLGAKAARAHVEAPALAALEAWFAAWSAEGDAVAAHLACAMDERATYRDDAVIAPDRDEVARHIARCHAQMPGCRLERTGPVLQTGDRLVCETALAGPGGRMGAALLACRLDRAGRIAEAVSFFRDAVAGVSDGPLLGPPA